MSTRPPRVGSHLRRNAVAYAALTLAFSFSPVPSMAADLVTTADIANGAVTKAKLAEDSVGGGKILNESVSGADIRDGTVGLADLRVPTYWNDSAPTPTNPWTAFGPTNPDFSGTGPVVARKSVTLAPLPAGNYNITATLQIAQGGSGRAGPVFCSLTGGIGGNLPRESVYLDVWSRTYEYISLRTLVVSNGSTRPAISCGGNTTGAATAWYYMDIIAEPAGELVRHAG